MSVTGVIYSRCCHIANTLEDQLNFAQLTREFKDLPNWPLLLSAEAEDLHVLQVICSIILYMVKDLSVAFN